MAQNVDKSRASRNNFDHYIDQFTRVTKGSPRILAFLGGKVLTMAG